MSITWTLARWASPNPNPNPNPFRSLLTFDIPFALWFALWLVFGCLLVGKSATAQSGIREDVSDLSERPVLAELAEPDPWGRALFPASHNQP